MDGELDPFVNGWLRAGCLGREIKKSRSTLSPKMSSELTAEKARQYSKISLFADKTWRWSQSPWSLPKGICQWMEDLSSAAISFYRAIDLLYRKSWRNESVLRNKDLLVPWVAEYYDAGKPSWLIEHGRSDAVRLQIPPVLRPDLIPHPNWPTPRL